MRKGSVFFCCFFVWAVLFTNITLSAEEKAAAAKAKEQPNPFAYTPPSLECTRAMLVEATESYIAAQEAGKPSKMALASDAKFFEDMNPSSKGKILVNTALPVAFHRSIYDSARCKSFTEVIVTEGAAKYVIGTRLTVNKGKIIEFNSLYYRQDRLVVQCR
jgi:hypothetical protein